MDSLSRSGVRQFVEVLGVLGYGLGAQVPGSVFCRGWDCPDFCLGFAFVPTLVPGLVFYPVFFYGRFLARLSAVYQ